MTSPLALRTIDLAVHFGGVRAVDGVDLEVAVGETRAVVGPNGAGKTSLFNLVSGHLEPTHGSVELFGREVTARPAHWRSRHGVSRTFQLSNLFGELTVHDNVALAVMGDDPATRRRFHLPLGSSPGVLADTAGVLAQFGLDVVADRRVDELGHGQQRVLEIAMAVAGSPRVLLLDEPTAGVGRAEAEELTALVAGLDEDLTVLVVEHDMAVAFALADRVTVMVEGRELLTDTPDVVRGHPDVVAAYLGRSAPDTTFPRARPGGVVGTGTPAVVDGADDATSPDRRGGTKREVARSARPADRTRAGDNRAAVVGRPGRDLPRRRGAILEVDAVAAHHGTSQVLHDTTLDVASGECLAVLGRNGMGKTTLVHVVAGLHPASGGTVRLAGRDVTCMPAQDRNRAGLALVPQGHRVFTSLTVRENLAVADRAGSHAPDDVLSRFSILGERAHQRAGDLSGGQQQVLALGRALVADARVAVMDEPSEGLDPRRVAQVTTMIRDLVADGTAVLLVEQRVAFALGVADRVAIMERGAIVEELDAATARDDPARLHRLLGLA